LAAGVGDSSAAATAVLLVRLRAPDFPPRRLRDRGAAGGASAAGGPASAAGADSATGSGSATMVGVAPTTPTDKRSGGNSPPRLVRNPRWSDAALAALRWAWLASAATSADAAVAAGLAGAAAAARAEPGATSYS